MYFVEKNDCSLFLYNALPNLFMLCALLNGRAFLFDTNIEYNEITSINADANASNT